MMSMDKTMKQWLGLSGCRLAKSALIAVLLSLASLSFGQVDRAALGQSLDMDLPPASLAVEMEVTGLEAASGTIYLDEEAYSLDLFREGASLLEAPRLQAGFDLETLRVGERVIVETDGTEPSDTHTPFIIAIRRP